MEDALIRISGINAKEQSFNYYVMKNKVFSTHPDAATERKCIFHWALLNPSKGPTLGTGSPLQQYWSKWKVQAWVGGWI